MGGGQSSFNSQGTPGEASSKTAEEETMVETARLKFNELDVDHSGKLSKAELTEFCNWMQVNYHNTKERLSKKEVDLLKTRLMNIFDENEDGYLTFNEFKELYDEVLKRIELVIACESKFHEFDRDHNGFIDKEEMLSLAEWILEKHHHFQYDSDTRRQVKESLIHKFDMNADGRLVICMSA